MYVHVRATAVFGVGFLVLLGYLVRHRARAGVLAAGVALGLLVLLLVQMAVGEIQYRNELPWWLVLCTSCSRRGVDVDRRARRGAVAHSSLAEPHVNWSRDEP